MEKLVPCQQAGAKFGKLCFSLDSRYLFCCCGSVIKVFNTTNGECVHDLKAHTKTVTGIYVNPSNVLQLYSCGQDRLLIVWDYLDGAKLKQYDLHFPLYGILSINPETKSIMIIAETSPQKKRFSLMQWKKKKDDPNAYCKPKTLIDSCSSNSDHVSFGCSREFVASGLEHNLTIYSMKKDSQKIVSDHDKYSKGRAITCVACHPNEYIIAAGLDNGKIILWHNFFSKQQQPIISRLHWHALSVLCLGFTPDGSNLLSGGHECVMVKWQMNNTEQRDFKPRMGAPLTQVVSSPDGAFYATQHTDNVVQLLNINLKVMQAYRGMTRGWLSPGNPAPCGLTFDPRSQCVVTNGLPGHLQFYSLALNKQLFNLDIVGENYISPENLDRPAVVTEVSCVVVSDRGDWLATFQQWDDGQFTPELRLKFWKWSSEAQTYSLNTTVESPHEGAVTKMAFRPQMPGQPGDSLGLVTLGTDSCFKLWGLVDDTDIYRSNMRWDCESVGFYRGLEAQCVDFSRDGTALSVGFGHLVTLWDPDHNIVQATLSNGLEDRPNVNNVLFGSKSCSHNLVVATNKTLLVWDLQTLTIQWRMEAEISHLVRDPASDLMAFVTADSSLQVFKPRSSTPVYQHKGLGNSPVRSTVFIPGVRGHDLFDLGWSGYSQIYMFTEDEELITLDLPGQTDRVNKVKVAQNLAPSAMQAFLAERQVRQTGGGVAAKTVPLNARNQANDEFISAMLHSNEPVSNLCGQFLRHLLVKSTKQNHEITNGDKGDDDDDSSSELDMETEEKEIIKDVNSEPADRKKDDVDMDKLLSKSTHWIDWAADLKL